MAAMECDVLIIGGGPAGLTAGMYTARRKLETIIVDKALPGGQMNLTHEIQNWPGTQTITGQELSKNMAEHAKKSGAKIIADEIEDVDPDGEHKKARGIINEYKAKAVIICTGGKHRPLNVPGEEELTGKGVSYCATCDAPFYKGKEVAVIGGGNSALEDSIYLHKIASKVHLIHRRDEFRAEPHRIEKAKKLGIHLITPKNAAKFEKTPEGKVKITFKEGGSITVDGVFISIGYVPATAMFKDTGLECDDKAYIKVNSQQETNVPGMYAAGDITGRLAQIVVAAGDGAVAGMNAYKYVQKPYWSDKK